jgi:sortase A
MTREEKIKFVALHTLGNFLILISLYGVVATFGPAVYYELQLVVMKTRGVQFTVATPQQVHQEAIAAEPVATHAPGFADILAGNTEQVLIPADTEFSITIPKIGASAKVFSNTDPANPTEFLPVLQHGVAHAKGSVFPGMKGNIYLFAHSADNWWNVGRYNAVFYLLKNLAVGDEIIVFFENRRYNYIVSQSLISEPTDVTLLTHMQTASQQLVLQTCWPPGTTWKRLYIVAKLKGE